VEKIAEVAVLKISDLVEIVVVEVVAVVVRVAVVIEGVVEVQARIGMTKLKMKIVGIRIQVINLDLLTEIRTDFKLKYIG
jgi:hypothetical protein